MKPVKGTINRVELIGWLGNAPEPRSLPSGVMVCNFNVATKRIGGRGEDGERMIETDWTPVEVWDRLAEQCSQMLHKGSRVHVTGSLHTRSWEDHESGQRRSKTFVRAEEVLFLDPRQEQDTVEAVDETTDEVPF